MVVCTSSQPSRRLSVWGLSYSLLFPYFELPDLSRSHSLVTWRLLFYFYPLIVLLRATCSAHFSSLSSPQRSLLNIAAYQSTLHAVFFFFSFPSFFSVSNNLGLISNLMNKVLVYLHIIHLLKSSTCFEHYPAYLQKVHVVIVYVQPLVSSLSAGDCLVHRLRKFFLNRCTRQSHAESTDTRGYTYTITT